MTVFSYFKHTGGLGEVTCLLAHLQAVLNLYFPGGDVIPVSLRFFQIVNMLFWCGRVLAKSGGFFLDVD